MARIRATTTFPGGTTLAHERDAAGETDLKSRWRRHGVKFRSGKGWQSDHPDRLWVERIEWLLLNKGDAERNGPKGNVQTLQMPDDTEG